MRAAVGILVSVLIIAAVIRWGHDQRFAGRAEQKKWDDSYYAAHPVTVVKRAVEIKLKRGWIYRNIDIDPAAKTVTGRCEQPAAPTPEKE